MTDSKQRYLASIHPCTAKFICRLPGTHHIPVVNHELCTRLQAKRGCIELIVMSIPSAFSIWVTKIPASRLNTLPVFQLRRWQHGLPGQQSRQKHNDHGPARLAHSLQQVQSSWFIVAPECYFVMTSQTIKRETLCTNEKGICLEGTQCIATVQLS